MTSRVSITGVVPDLTLTFPTGSLEVSTWPQMKPLPGVDFYGVCSHHFKNEAYGDVDAWTQKLADMGVRTFRTGAFAKLDQVKRMAVRARELGLKVLGQVATETTPEKELRANLAFVLANADIFVGIEGINEPDGDGLKDAEVTWVVKAQKIIWDYVNTHPELSHITVLSPALRRPAKPILFQRFVDAGLPGTFHAVSLHHYGKGGMIQLDGPDGLDEHISMIQNMWKCDRFWVTETGSTNALQSPDPRRCSEDASAAYSVRNILDLMSDPRVERMFRYELMDDAGPLTNNEAHFGLFHIDGTPKDEVFRVYDYLNLTQDVRTFDPAEIELEVTAPEGVRYQVRQVSSYLPTVWFWRPGVLWDAEPVECLVRTPSWEMKAPVGGAAYGVGIPLEV